MAKGEIFTGLPKWAQGVIVVAAVAGTALTVYAVVKVVKRKKLLEGANKEIGNTNETIRKLEAVGQKATLDNLKLSTIANQLFSAMNNVYTTTKMGTDTAAVYRAFTNVKNDIDVINLVKIFGIKKAASGSMIVPDFEGTLSQHLTERLSPSEMKALNDLLSRKGIKYRF